MSRVTIMLCEMVICTERFIDQGKTPSTTCAIDNLCREVFEGDRWIALHSSFIPSIPSEM